MTSLSVFACSNRDYLQDNEDQRIFADRLPFWPGNHRSIHVEHSAFIANSVHGISMRGVLDARLFRSATFGDPDAMQHGAPTERARATMLLRTQNSNVNVEGCLVEELSLERARDFNVTGNLLSAGNTVMQPWSSPTVFPLLTDSTRTMRQRFELSAAWVAAHPGVGPDILMPLPSTSSPSPSAPPPSTVSPIATPLTVSAPPVGYPAAPPPPATIVTFSLLASGEIADYTPAVLESITSVIAAAAGVQVSTVTIDVAAGSVLLTARILVASTDEATVVTSAVAGRIATPAAATALLSNAEGISIVVHNIVSAPRAQLLQSPPPFSGEFPAPANGFVVPIAIGSVIGFLALAFAAIAALMAYRRRAQRGGRHGTEAPPAPSIDIRPCCYRLGRGSDQVRGPAAAPPVLQQKVQKV